MPLNSEFVKKEIRNMQINEYLSKLLSETGFTGVDIQQTTTGIKITIKTARPGQVIGKKGVKIKELSHLLTQKFGIENPIIDVELVETPELNANIMAESIAFGIKKGQNYRRTAYSIMRRIIRAGARGVEVSISGKSTSQRARTQIFRSGIISKCGGPALEGVNKGMAEVILKSGKLGIQVKIMPLEYKLPDEIEIKDPELQEKLKQIHKKQSSDSDVIMEEYDIDETTKEIIVEDEEEETIFDILDEEEAEIENIEEIPKEELVKSSEVEEKEKKTEKTEEVAPEDNKKDEEKDSAKKEQKPEKEPKKKGRRGRPKKEKKE